MCLAYLLKKIREFEKAGILALLLSMLLMLPISSQAQQMEDTEISCAVENQLIVDEGVPAHLINVQTKDGIVSFSGSVVNLLAKERVERVAQDLCKGD